MATIFGCIINCPQVPTIFPCTNPKKMQNRLIFSLPLGPKKYFSLSFLHFLGVNRGSPPKAEVKNRPLGHWLNIAARRRLGLLCGSLHRPCGAVYRDADCQVRGCAAAVSWGYEWSFPTWHWKQNRWDDFRWQVNFCWRFLLFFFWWPEWLAFQCLIGCHFYGPLCHTHRGVSFFRVSLGSI